MTPTLLLALTLFPAAPGPKAKPAADPLLGRWVATAMTVSGRPDPQWAGLEYEFAPGGRWVIYRHGTEDAGGARAYTSDPKTKVPTIDLIDGKATYPGVYKVEGDTLTLSLPTVRGGERPADLQPGPAFMTLTFQRVKKD